MTTFAVVGTHGIRVASGDFSPGATGVVLTEDEATRLRACGAVAVETTAAGTRESGAGLADPPTDVSSRDASRS